MTTELDLLAAARPRPALTPDAVFPAADRTHLVDAIVTRADDRPRSGTNAGRWRVARRGSATQRWSKVTALGAVAAAVVLVMVELALPVGIPGGPPNANAAIERLAITAGAAPGDALTPGQYRHFTEHITMGNETAVLETWTAADGYTWRYDTVNGFPEYFASAPSTSFDTADPSPAFLAHLPIDTAALDSYLRAHVTGSHSTDEAVFVAVGDILRSNLAPAALRGAAIRVLERTGHVSTTQARDSLGRPAVKVTFTDPAGLSGPESMLFDSTTSALLEEQQGPHYTATYTLETVDAVPADVLAHTRDPQRQNCSTANAAIDCAQAPGT